MGKRDEKKWVLYLLLETALKLSIHLLQPPEDWMMACATHLT